MDVEVVDTPEWSETIVDRPAYDETIVDVPQYYETVVDVVEYTTIRQNPCAWTVSTPFTTAWSPDPSTQWIDEELTQTREMGNMVQTFSRDANEVVTAGAVQPGRILDPSP